MAEIKMTNSDKLVLVDDEDYPVLARSRWMLQPIRTREYAVTTIMNKNAYMHRIVLGSPEINKQHRVIDHINGNGLDNRKENLRWATYSENAQNRRLELVKGLLGVNWAKFDRKWTAAISKDKKTYNLGLFECEKAAGRAYDKMARLLYGEHAAVNFPKELENDLIYQLQRNL